MNSKLLLCLAVVLSCLLTGCTTPPDHPYIPPHIPGNWKVSGTDNVLKLRKTDRSARLTTGGKTIVGTYYYNMTPDLLKVIFPGNSPQSAGRTIIYLVPLDSRKGRSLTVFADTEVQKP